MSWTGCEQQRVASPRGVACIIVRIATTEVKRLLKKSKKRREREASLFFVFSFRLVFLCMCARGGAQKLIIVTRTRLKIHSIQLNSLFNFYTKFTHVVVVISLLKRKVNTHIIKRTTGTNKVNTERQKEKEFI